MEVLSIILSMIAVVQGALSLKDKLTSNENKEEVSQLLTNIGNVLVEVSKEMKSGIYPASKCSELNYYMQHIKDSLSKHLDISEVENLGNLIAEAHQVERLFGELQASNNEQRMLNFQKLEEAAGAFIAAGNLYRIQ